MHFINKAERLAFGKKGIWSPYYQTAAMVILEPDVIASATDTFIRVETCGNLARGAFLRDDKSNVSNVRLITEVNKSLLKEALIKYMTPDSKMCI